MKWKAFRISRRSSQNPDKLAEFILLLAISNEICVMNSYVPRSKLTESFRRLEYFCFEHVVEILRVALFLWLYSVYINFRDTLEIIKCKGGNLRTQTQIIIVLPAYCQMQSEI